MNKTKLINTLQDITDTVHADIICSVVSRYILAYRTGKITAEEFTKAIKGIITL